MLVWEYRNLGLDNINLTNNNLRYMFNLQKKLGSIVSKYEVGY